MSPPFGLSTNATIRKRRRRRSPINAGLTNNPIICGGCRMPANRQRNQFSAKCICCFQKMNLTNFYRVSFTRLAHGKAPWLCSHSILLLSAVALCGPRYCCKRVYLWHIVAVCDNRRKYFHSALNTFECVLPYSTKPSNLFLYSFCT